MGWSRQNRSVWVFSKKNNTASRRIVTDDKTHLFNVIVDHVKIAEVGSLEEAKKIAENAK